MEENILAQEFTPKSTIKFAIPTTIMMVFLAAYPIADGVFVANFVSENALAAINIATPLIGISIAVALMIASGGNAIIGILLGERRDVEARGFFSFVYALGILIGIVFSLVSVIFCKEIALLLGASEALLDNTATYIRAIGAFTIMGFMQGFALTFMITVGKSQVAFIACILGGVANILLDYVFIVLLDLGIGGAGVATGVGYMVPGLIGLIYFASSRKSVLRFVRPTWNVKDAIAIFTNGISEFIGNVSGSITTFVFNAILLAIAGEAGVTAISIILQVQLIQIAIYSGFSMAVFPIISFKYGEKNGAQLRTVIQTSYVLLFAFSVLIVIASLIFAEQAVGIFIRESSETFAMAVLGFRLFSLNYLFRGVNIFTSSMFTALSDGKVSGIISVCNSLVFILVALFVLPMIGMGLVGVWLAVPVAQLLGVGVSYYYYKKKREVYLY